MNYDTFRVQVQYNLGNRDDDVTLALIMSKLNLAIDLLDVAEEWPDFQKVAAPALVIGQTDYTLAALSLSDFRKIYTFSVNDGSSWRPPLGYIVPLAFQAEVLAGNYQTSGVPTVYTLFGGTFSVDHKPAAAYSCKILYYGYPTKVTSGSSNIPFTNKEGILEALTTWLCWTSLGDYKAASAWYNIAKTLLEGIGIDSRRILNFQPSSKVAPTTPANTWQDPFKRV